MSIILRDYQEQPARDALLMTKNILALCPGSGKTEIAIYLICKYIEENPNKRILILTHSTNILLDNFFNRIEGIDVNFTYSKDVKDTSQVHLCLPNKENDITGNYGLVIIDEAHENYLADQVQKILTKTSPDKELLLTATPSKFINNIDEYNIQVVAANEISSEYFSKLGIELVASNYDWGGHYNTDNEVRENFVYKRDDTYETLNNLITNIIKRLRYLDDAKRFNLPNLLSKCKNNFKDWFGIYNQLGKTMIVCKAIPQADQVFEILTSAKVDVQLSHSKNDPDSINMGKFKNNEFNVLVVVGRGRIGYNDEKLFNMIDLSGTHNPDLIYQMFSRLVRGNPKLQKFYIKATPKRHYDMHLTHISTCVALMLTDRRYILEYSGIKNSNVGIPVIKEVYEKSRYTNENKEERRDKKQTFLPYFNSFDTIEMFKNIQHDLEKDTSIYKMTSITKAREVLGLTNTIKYSYDEILENATKFNETFN